ncbi:unnamed protein product [Effrenium voratum]|uniref:Serine aminopeptidase S33 domain-containing protein n=1 Tax=Effrenium voratum TaxID=2562239 RepID=A0AA36JGF8_9DINO|nr:unnamed protein product [Effrenium voratum]CAJ1437774.1 unnamed protein product [Effrenium voratum]
MVCCGAMAMPPHLPLKYGQAKPQAEGGDFHRSSDGRLWLFTRSWEPSEPWATLMIVHGTVDHSGVYSELGQFLAAQGVAVFASDMRGWGRSDGEPLYLDNIKSFMGDILADYEHIHAASPYSQLRARFLLGKSIGGLITAWAAAEHPDKWTGLIGLSGAYQVDPSVKPPFLLLKMVEMLSYFAPKMPLKPPFDPKLIVSDEEALQEWEQDPLVSRGKITVGYICEMLRLQGELDSVLQMHMPALMLWGTGDQVVTEAGHQMVLDASNHPESEFLKYPGGYHNLLAEPQLKESVMRDILGWLRKVVARAGGE